MKFSWLFHHPFSRSSDKTLEWRLQRIYTLWPCSGIKLTGDAVEQIE